MKRMCTITRLRPEKAEEYIRLHDEIWPDVVEASHICNTRNFTIFQYGYYLINYSEYVGDDFEADMKKKSEMDAIRRWKEVTSACMEPVSPEASVIVLKEVFHCDF